MTCKDTPQWYVDDCLYCGKAIPEPVAVSEMDECYERLTFCCVEHQKLYHDFIAKERRMAERGRS